jgi:hypothetical protein
VLIFDIEIENRGKDQRPMWWGLGARPDSLGRGVERLLRTVTTTLGAATTIQP